VSYALGETPPVVMAEMGHSDAALALRIYAQAIRRDEAERGKLQALVEGGKTPINANEADLADSPSSISTDETGETG
jgi:hypothetical protein